MPSGSESRTLSTTEDTGDPRGLDARPHLYLVLDAHRPLAAPVRLALGDVEEVVLGRGSGRLVEASSGDGTRRLVVRTDDRRMSSTHARIQKLLRRWVIEDSGSKNGTLVNGVARTRVPLADGDVIELGHTFFLFREAVLSDPRDPAVLDARDLAPPVPGMATLLPGLARDFDRLASVACSPAPIVVEGETGTGKEVMAQAVHRISGRAGAFVAVNCGALPRDLVEGELFGHKKGAFSGATEDRAGLVRSAHRGTLFLDEIGDLPAPAQAALLRVLQEHEVRPIGETRATPVDLRVVAATHRSLDAMVTAGEFRADLLNRLAGHRFALPPLRARREDLGLILGALLARLADGDAAAPSLHPRAARALLGHGWPGNVRELEQCVGSALALARAAGSIELEHLPQAVQRVLGGGSTGRGSADAGQREEILALLREHQGNVSAVAKHMGKARMQVQRWLKRYAIDPAQFRR
jgi:transcriptional regulator of acetoin/glycerol metabolism